MQHTSVPFTLAFGPQGCMAEVKGRVVAVWCHAEWSRLFCEWVDFPQFIPHNMIPVESANVNHLEEQAMTCPIFSCYYEKRLHLIACLPIDVVYSFSAYSR
jgi:hypothetical protein